MFRVVETVICLLWNVTVGNKEDVNLADAVYDTFLALKPRIRHCWILAFTKISIMLSGTAIDNCIASLNRCGILVGEVCR